MCLFVSRYALLLSCAMFWSLQPIPEALQKYMVHRPTKVSLVLKLSLEWS